MNLEMRKNHQLRMELDIIAEIESHGGAKVKPDNPNEKSFGRYQLNTLGLVDAVQHGVQTPEQVSTIIGDWAGKSYSDRLQTQDELLRWMQKNQLQVDSIAEHYYEKVVRPRADGSAPVAIMMWQAPGATKKDLDALGLKPSEVGESPDAAQMFLNHIQSEGAIPSRATRARRLGELLPMLDRVKGLPPSSPDKIPSAPLDPKLKQPNDDPRIPYPSTEVTDPWMQHGHTVAYRDSLREFDRAFGTKTTDAALALQSASITNPSVRRMGNVSKQLDVIEATGGPIEGAIELIDAPYGITKALVDVIHDQFSSDMNMTERLGGGATVTLPLLVGGLFSRGKFMSKPKATGEGIDMKPPAEAVQKAKDYWRSEADSAKAVRSGAEINLETAKAAGDQEMVKDASNQLRQAKQRETYATYVLDKDKGPKEIEFLKAERAAMEESENFTPKQLQALDKKIDAAQRRVDAAAKELNLPSVADMDGALQVYRNAVKSAKIPAETLDRAIEEKIRTGKVSYETILARDLDAAVDPITAGAELKLVQDAHETIENLRQAYLNNQGDIVVSNQFLTAINKYAPLLAKERRSEIRAGQSVEVLGGKSRSLRSFETVIEEFDGQNVPSIMQVWSTAKTDLDRMAQLRNYANPGVFKGAALQMITNNLISSPSTATWNAISMGAMTLSRMNELRMLGKLAPGLYAPDDASVFGVALVNYYGRLLKGDKAARASFSAEMDSAALHAANVDPGVMQKYNFRNTISVQGPAADSAWGKSINFTGHMINLPTQVSAWTDAIFRVGLKDAFSSVHAHNMAYQELQAQVTAGAKYTDREINALMLKRKTEIMSDPNAMIMVDGKAQLLREVAGEESATIAMMGKLQSQTMGGLEAWANNSLLARMVIPFPHPFLQTAEMALERTPMGRMLPHMKADLAAGGARAAAARAKLATGNQTAALFAMFAGATYLADSDSFGYTGSGPANKAQRTMWAATHKADTITLNGKEIPLAKLGPVGQVMSFTADAMGAVNEAINMGAGRTPPLDVLAAVVASWTSLVSSELFADDVRDIAAAVLQRDSDALERVVERKATMLVPAGALGKDIVNIVTDARQILQTHIGDTKMVTPLNFWGDPTRYYGTQNPLFTLIGVTEQNAPNWERKNAVSTRLINDGVAVKAPDKYLTSNGVTIELSLEQKYAAMEFFSKADIGGTLLDNLEGAVRGSVYGKLLDGSGEDTINSTRYRVGTKQDYIDMVIKGRKDATNAWLLGASPYAKDLQERLMNTVQLRGQQLDDLAATAAPLKKGTAASPFGMGGVQ